MKCQLLLALFLVLSLSGFSQYSRSFYMGESNRRPISSLVSIRGQTTVISIANSGNDTLRVLLIDIDDRGETSNYRSYSYSPFDVAAGSVLSGAGVNSLGNITLCVLSPNGSQNVDVSCISVNPSNGAFTNYTFENGLYKKGYTRSRVKGDSLISYMSSSNGQGLLRVARSMTNTGTSTEIVNPSLSYNGNMTSNIKIVCELIINGNDEYIAVQNTIVKRNGANNYIEAVNLAPLSPPCLTVTSTGDLFAYNRGGNAFQRFDANLNLLSSGTLAGVPSTLPDLLEMYALPNNAVRLWMSIGSSVHVLDIDAANTISQIKSSRSFPLNHYKLDGKQYVIGFDPVFISATKIDGNSPQYSNQALSVVQDDLSNSIPEFIEYGQKISTDKLEFHTSHNGQCFQIPTSTAGLNFKQNNLSRSVLFAARQGIIGQNLNGNLLGTKIYYPEGAGIVTGPYTSLGNYSHEQMDKYNRGYFVTRDMINAHILEITAGNPTYTIPFGIQEWPAHGDVSLGQAANLASFFDQNSNGTYEPELGDYPMIYGDQCLLNIYHQHPNAAQGASIETHQYYFTFDCDQVEAIENTVFMRTHNFARTETLYNTHIGNYADFDIGGAPDDYYGSHVGLGMIYGYNADQFDETANGTSGFQDTIPAVGLLSLRGAKLDPNGSDNTIGVGLNESINGMGFGDGIVDNEYFTQEAAQHYSSTFFTTNSITEQYNIFQGNQPDGLPIEINGITIHHKYFGTSDPLFYTSDGIDHGNNYDLAAASYPPGDFRVVAGSGPMTFTTIDTLVLIDAFVVGVDTVSLSPANSLLHLFEHGQTLRDFYIQNASACGNNFDPYISNFILSAESQNIEQLLLYPNPTSASFKLKGISGEASVRIFDLNGRIVGEASNFTDGQEMSIEGLDNAVYLVTVEDENGKRVIRVVKR